MNERPSRAEPLAGISLRPATEADLPFLAALYADTRSGELAAVPWSDADRTAFLQTQFEAQHRHYHEHYPGAEFDIIERAGRPIGRLYLHRTPAEHRLMDIALIAAERNQGIGGALMQDLLAKADRLGLPVRLHVERSNPAYGFYRRLGFRDLEDRGVYIFMERRPR